MIVIIRGRFLVRGWEYQKENSRGLGREKESKGGGILGGGGGGGGRLVSWISVSTDITLSLSKRMEELATDLWVMSCMV